MDINGKSAVVIGGTHGMGGAVADLLRSRGAKVVVTGSNPANIERLRAAGHDAVRLDLASADDIAALPSHVTAPIDAVFVFAGIAEFAPLIAVTSADFDRLFAVNARGSFFAVQALLPKLVDGGSITLATVTPATASPGMGVYMASKAALRGWSQVLAAELLPRRIRVNTIAPGFIDTPTLGIAGLSAEDRAAFSAAGDAATPMHRHGTPEEVARAALFLAFEATFCTGIELPVDGGLSTVDAP